MRHFFRQYSVLCTFVNYISISIITYNEPNCHQNQLKHFKRYYENNAKNQFSQGKESYKSY